MFKIIKNKNIKKLISQINRNKITSVRDQIKPFESTNAPEGLLGLPRYFFNIKINRSQAILLPHTSELIYTSGLYGITSKGDLIGPGIKEQTEQLLKNLEKILEDADSSLDV